MPDAPLTFYEFFAGGGMARTGLGAGWRCLFANDFDPRKTAVYRDNFGGDDLAGREPYGAPQLDVAFALNMGSFSEKHGLSSGGNWTVRIERAK